MAIVLASLGAGLTGCERSQEIKIGLVTALSGHSAKSGEALSRGLLLAIDEINSRGGLLGCKLSLVSRDDQSDVGRGVIAARELIYKENVAALFGGLDTPVARAIIPIVSAAKKPFIIPWAAGTAITRNGLKPNFVFRVSAVDEEVDQAMVDFAVAKYGARRPGLILINNPWGQSNEKGLKAALASRAMPMAGVEHLEMSDVDLSRQLGRLRSAKADSLLLVAPVGPSAQVVRALDQMRWEVPVVSHWGPAGGRFQELAGARASTVKFIQTYSFFGSQSPAQTRVFAALKAKYPDIRGPEDVTPAVGVANAYDAMHLTALAIKAAGSLDGDAIRRGFGSISEYDGLIKFYRHPFADGQHDALGRTDYIWAEFRENRIMPVSTTES